jgi:hypothetical protein
MTQRMPVVRQLQWMGLIPQFVAIAVLAGIAHVVLPNPGIPIDILSQHWFTSFFAASCERNLRETTRTE